MHAFFVGRAFAEVLTEQVEQTMTSAMSDLGRFDAEQRERLRQFSEQVLDRATQAETAATAGRSPVPTGGEEDLQAMLDELRAEIAQLRTELQRYRSPST